MLVGVFKLSEPFLEVVLLCKLFLPKTLRHEAVNDEGGDKLEKESGAPTTSKVNGANLAFHTIVCRPLGMVSDEVDAICQSAAQ